MAPRRSFQAFDNTIAREFEPRRIILSARTRMALQTSHSDVDLLTVFPDSGSAIDRALDIRLALEHPGFAMDLRREIAKVLRVEEPGDQP